MKQIKNIISGFSLLLLLLVAPMDVHAQYAVSQPPSAQLLIDKKVFNPLTKTFVDNLTVDQYKFLPAQEVTFNIWVQNTGNSDLNNLTVTDRLPKELLFESGTGNYDATQHTFSFFITKLSPGEYKSTDFRIKVKNAQDLMNTTSCVSNLAEVKTDTMLQQDTASLCITKNVLGETTQLPKTGASDFGLLLISTIVFAAGSLMLAQKKRVA